MSATSFPGLFPSRGGREGKSPGNEVDMSENNATKNSLEWPRHQGLRRSILQGRGGRGVEKPAVIGLGRRSMFS